MRRLVSAILLFCIAAAAQAGLILEQSGGINAAGNTVVYDLILRNEPISLPGATWNNISAIGPVNFQAPQPNSPGSLAPTFSTLPFPPSVAGITPNAADSWNLFLAGSDILFQHAPFDLAPQQEVKFATLSIDLPIGFFGTFDLVLDKTTMVLAGATSVVDWTQQLNPAFGASDLPPPPSGGLPPVPFTFTSVPEPSPFILLGVAGILVSAIRFVKRRSNGI